MARLRQSTLKRLYRTRLLDGKPAHFQEIGECFIRKGHACGKYLSVSKSCFIACPSDEDVHTILDLISEKLIRFGIEPVIAIRERVYGQDIFCTKICGKIIESQFCIAILDDSLDDGKAIPNPNVYYEYGLMTSLGKHIIPLQRQSHSLAFNIQTHDTIKYTSSNLSTELDTAFKDAVKKSEDERSITVEPTPDFEHLVTRCIEINGYKEAEYEWLQSIVEDTMFRAFIHQEQQQCCICFVAEDQDELTESLTDLQVILKRLEKSHVQFSAQLNKLKKNLKETEAEIKKGGTTRYALSVRNRPETLSTEIDKTSQFIALIEHTIFSIILSTSTIQHKKAIIAHYENIQQQVLKLPLYIGNEDGVTLGDEEIIFKRPSLSTKQEN